TPAPVTPAPVTPAPVLSTPAPVVLIDSDEDCISRLTDNDKAYNELYEKSIYYVEDCSGMHCNQFNIDNDCRGCWNSC
ncbi:unnamed protein product, partial [Choristocarpus tenellus]